METCGPHVQASADTLLREPPQRLALSWDPRDFRSSRFQPLGLQQFLRLPLSRTTGPEGMLCRGFGEGPPPGPHLVLMPRQVGPRVWGGGPMFPGGHGSGQDTTVHADRAQGLTDAVSTG